MKEVTKLTARANYQMIWQGSYESIIAFKERFNFALKACEDQGNKKLDDPDIAMDFFWGLDNVRYTTFKTDYLNGLTSKAIDPPKDLNEIYLLANQWLKPKATTSSFASTFSTTLDRVDREMEGVKERVRNSKEERKNQTRTPMEQATTVTGTKTRSVPASSATRKDILRTRAHRENKQQQQNKRMMTNESLTLRGKQVPL